MTSIGTGGSGMAAVKPTTVSVAGSMTP